MQEKREEPAQCGPAMCWQGYEQHTCFHGPNTRDKLARSDPRGNLTRSQVTQLQSIHQEVLVQYAGLANVQHAHSPLP